MDAPKVSNQVAGSQYASESEFYIKNAKNIAPNELLGTVKKVAKDKDLCSTVIHSTPAIAEPLRRDIIDAVRIWSGKAHDIGGDTAKEVYRLCVKLIKKSEELKNCGPQHEDAVTFNVGEGEEQAEVTMSGGALQLLKAFSPMIDATFTSHLKEKGRNPNVIDFKDIPANIFWQIRRMLENPNAQILDSVDLLELFYAVDKLGIDYLAKRVIKLIEDDLKRSDDPLALISYLEGRFSETEAGYKEELLGIVENGFKEYLFKKRPIETNLSSLVGSLGETQEQVQVAEQNLRNLSARLLERLDKELESVQKRQSEIKDIQDGVKGLGSTLTPEDKKRVSDFPREIQSLGYREFDILIMRGKIYHFLGGEANLNKALEDLQKSNPYGRKDANVGLQISEIYSELGSEDNLRKALDWSSNALSFATYSGERPHNFYIVRSEIFIKKKNWKKALDSINAISPKDAEGRLRFDNPTANLRRAKIYYMMNEIPLANEFLDHIFRTDKNGKWVESETKFNECVKEKNFWALALKGAVHLKRWQEMETGSKEWEQEMHRAIVALEAAHKLNPKNEFFVARIKELQSLATATPGPLSHEYVRIQSMTSVEKEKYNKLMEEARNMAKKILDNIDLEKPSESLDDELEEAVANFTKALNEDPNNIDALFQRREVYYSQQKWDLAEADNVKLEELKSDLIQKGTVYRQQGNLKEALEILNNVIKVYPNNSTALIQRAAVYLQRNQEGDKDNSLYDINNVIKNNPRNPQIAVSEILKIVRENKEVLDRNKFVKQVQKEAEETVTKGGNKTFIVRKSSVDTDVTVTSNRGGKVFNERFSRKGLPPPTETFQALEGEFSHDALSLAQIKTLYELRFGCICLNK